MRRGNACLTGLLILLLDYSQLGLGHDGCELIVGHIDGALELCGVSSAERRWLAIGPVSPIGVPFSALADLPPVVAMPRFLSTNEPCLRLFETAIRRHDPRRRNAVSQALAPISGPKYLILLG